MSTLRIEEDYVNYLLYVLLLRRNCELYTAKLSYHKVDDSVHMPFPIAGNNFLNDCN